MYHCHPHFTEKETEAQRNRKTWPRSHSEQSSQDLAQAYLLTCLIIGGSFKWMQPWDDNHFTISHHTFLHPWGPWELAPRSTGTSTPQCLFSWKWKIKFAYILILSKVSLNCQEFGHQINAVRPEQARLLAVGSFQQVDSWLFQRQTSLWAQKLLTCCPYAGSLSRQEDVSSYQQAQCKEKQVPISIACFAPSFFFLNKKLQSCFSSITCQNSLTSGWVWIRERRWAKAAVPNLFGNMDWFRGRQFFHGAGSG